MAQFFCCKVDVDGGNCSADLGEERYSLGIYAGKYCDFHWLRSGYRDEGSSGFDPVDCGERYEDDY
jgi:hypothetical protein